MLNPADLWGEPRPRASQRACIELGVDWREKGQEPILAPGLVLNC